mmetsp:Transcript_17259/g.42830  ORF Transcript_17259/g.42830 Transcript_17259/m.42830 type:complete len:223 (-) Transcript_17259:2362-3030(-)
MMHLRRVVVLVLLATRTLGRRNVLRSVGGQLAPLFTLRRALPRGGCGFPRGLFPLGLLGGYVPVVFPPSLRVLRLSPALRDRSGGGARGAFLCCRSRPAGCGTRSRRRRSCRSCTTSTPSCSCACSCASCCTSVCASTCRSCRGLLLSGRGRCGGRSSRRMMLCDRCSFVLPCARSSGSRMLIRRCVILDLARVVICGRSKLCSPRRGRVMLRRRAVSVSSL